MVPTPTAANVPATRLPHTARSMDPRKAIARAVDSVAHERTDHGDGASSLPVAALKAGAHAVRGAMRQLPGHRVREVRRRGHHPLPSLPQLHPEARLARPVEIGLRTIDVADIHGTAVGGGDQRGGDFLPLKPFRGTNWQGRWQRLRKAHERLADLPPIDVVKYAGGYWVIDGHNRVGLALYAGQPDIDASVVELVPPGGRRTEPIGTLESELEESRRLRGRVDTLPENPG